MNGLKVREPLRALAFPGQTACSCCATDMLGSIRQSTVNACLAFLSMQPLDAAARSHVA